MHTPTSFASDYWVTEQISSSLKKGGITFFNENHILMLD